VKWKPEPQQRVLAGYPTLLPTTLAFSIVPITEQNTRIAFAMMVDLDLTGSLKYLVIMPAFLSTASRRRSFLASGPKSL
jgi:hypothetical protein